jgi:S-adenosylmethionine hydrolase
MINSGKFFLLSIIFFLHSCKNNRELPTIVLQTDFGLKDGAVAAMKGVIVGVDPAIKIYDLTHDIPAYDTWEAAYRLQQTAEYWPAGTIFVSVVDPGVGTNRKSIILKTKSGHFFVSPDNGTLTLVSEQLGIAEVRQIDEAINRRQSSGSSYTFHGRDVYAYTAGRLAAGVITFDQVGKRLPDSVTMMPYQKAVMQKDTIRGMIPILDTQYGNVWTNIPDSLMRTFKYGDTITCSILNNGRLIFAGSIPLAKTFGEVAQGQVMGYYNSLMQFSLAINQGNFADSFHIGTGPEWQIACWK